MRTRLGMVSLALVLPLVFASPAGATTPIRGTGTFTDLSATTTSFRTTPGGNTFITEALTGTFTGVIAGTYARTINVVVHPDGTETFNGSDTCSRCTIWGKAGPLMDNFWGTAAADDTFQGSFVVSGAGALAGLHGEGTFIGSGNGGTYSVGLHFDP